MPESDEFNNCSSLPFFVNASDLTTRFLTMQGSPRVGQPVSFSGQIWNVGTASSTSYWLRFCHDNQNCLTQTEPATNQIGSDGSQNGLGPNTTWGTLNSDQWIPGPGDAGPHTVQFCADVAGHPEQNIELDESNPVNNCSSLSFTVAPPSPP